MSDWVLGVDGGGTKTEAWLTSLRGAPGEAPTGRGLAGPGNPRSAGFDVALANLDAAVAAAFADAGLPRQPVRAACLGLAGADRATERWRLAQWCGEADLAERVVLTNDAEPLLAAAGDDVWGIALIAGTGSFAFGSNPAGQNARSGGWGYLLGDEGSGYAIALAGLRRAARAADQRAAPTKMLEGFLAALHCSRPSDLIETVYQPEFRRQQMADLADVVFEAAAADDTAATEILEEAARELAGLVTSLITKLELPIERVPLAVAGGLLLQHTRLREGVVRELESQGVTLSRLTCVTEPVRGAVVLAQRVALRPEASR